MKEKLFDLEQYAACARQCAAEGIVLLKNDRNALPLAAGTRIALFGRSQLNYYKSGTGSGGMVNTRYVTGIREALEADSRFSLESGLKERYDTWVKDHPFDPGQGWGNEPWVQGEMPITEEIARAAAEHADTAIVLIGRTAGEDKDNSSEKGSWFLTDDEEAMLSAVTAAFSKTIVLLNTGNIMDMSWIVRYAPAAVAYVWQGGQEGGNGVLDVLSGDVNPCGKLTDTIAADIADYPSTKNFGSMDRNILEEDIFVGYRYFETFAREKVLFPFGYGLSYTDFEIRTESFERNADGVKLRICVKNTGNAAGKEVVQIYVEAPQGLLGKARRALAGFSKTGIIPAGESVSLDMEIPDAAFASYDETGKTGYRSAYVMEAGEYVFYVGSDVRSAKAAGSFALASTKLLSQVSEALAPVTPFQRMVSLGGELSYEDVPLATQSPLALRSARLPADLAYTGDRGWKLPDIAEGNCSMEDFIAQLSNEDLTCLVRGEGMSSPKVTPGCGGAFGGVTESLHDFGIPVACVTDGPSGIRMDSGRQAFALPNGTCLASTWNMALLEELFAWEGLELRKNRIDALLGPGMNIHRNPLCGRNFEYFSEDPLLTGKCASAELRGMRRFGVGGVIKHFILNTQEAGRRKVEHVVSERAAREIYLRGFEIAVKEGGADAVMTTYGPVNGTFTASNYDLVTRILREEWGYTGVVMTDWWAAGSEPGAPGDMHNMASIIRAQNDLYMVAASAKDNTNHDNSIEALARGAVTRGEYQRSAANICRYILGKPVFVRMLGVGDELDRRLESELDEEELVYNKIVNCPLDAEGRGKVPADRIDISKGAATMIAVPVVERGLYKLKLTLRAKPLGSLAQIPMSIYRDKELLKTITLTGDDTQWQTVEIHMSPALSSFYLKLYFAQAGMEIDRFEVSLVRSLEAQIRQARESLVEKKDTADEEPVSASSDPHRFYSMDTPVNILMKDERFKAALAKEIPTLANHGLLRSVTMSFRAVKPMAEGMMPPQVFDAVEKLLQRLAQGE